MIVCVENIHVHVGVLLKLTIIIDVMNKYTTNRLSHVLQLTTIPLCVMMHPFSEIISVEVDHILIFLYISIHSLGDNSIKDEGAVAISEAMKAMTNLQEL